MKKKDPSITRRKLRSSYATSIVSISLVLFLLGLVGLLLLNAQRLSTYVLENLGFTVVLKEDAKEVDIIRLQKNLDAKEYVKSTDYITKEEAARETSEELGENFIEFLGYNPLPASIVVKFYAQYANPDSMAAIEKELSRFEEVDEVMYQESLIHLVNEEIGSSVDLPHFLVEEVLRAIDATSDQPKTPHCKHARRIDRFARPANGLGRTEIF